jgi:hypothetical protein
MRQSAALGTFVARRPQGVAVVAENSPLVQQFTLLQQPQQKISRNSNSDSSNQRTSRRPLYPPTTARHRRKNVMPTTIVSSRFFVRHAITPDTSPAMR